VVPCYTTSQGFRGPHIQATKPVRFRLAPLTALAIDKITRLLEHCKCNKIDDSEFLGPKVEKLTSIIEAGGVPLVKLTNKGRGVFIVDIS
jgi:hypothetical protein